VYGGSVTRFLGGGLRGVVSRVIRGVRYGGVAGVAVMHDGHSVLLSSAYHGGPSIVGHSIVQVGLGHGDSETAPRIVGGSGLGPLQFKYPHQICVASDGFVFIADHGNDRVQVLSPDLTFHRFIGDSGGPLFGPSGVCANADVVVVTQTLFRQIVVLRRDDGTLVRHFSLQGRADGKLLWPVSVCFLPDNRHIAGADPNRGCVSIFSVDGDLIRTVGDGVLRYPRAVACSAYGELVVADASSICVVDDSDRVVQRFGDGGCSGVAVHGCSVVSLFENHCSVFE
jgi:hypothetical protein